MNDRKSTLFLMAASERERKREERRGEERLRSRAGASACNPQWDRSLFRWSVHCDVACILHCSAFWRPLFADCVHLPALRAPGRCTRRTSTRSSLPFVSYSLFFYFFHSPVLFPMLISQNIGFSFLPLPPPLKYKYYAYTWKECKNCYAILVLGIDCRYDENCSKIAVKL